LGCALLFVLASPAIAGPPMAEMFTYQGQLREAGVPANGEYDFEFKLFDNFTGGSQVSTTKPKSNVDVIDGLFTVGLDWPVSVFDGTDMYLQVEVRPGASTGAYTELSPRQFVMGTPYAFRAHTADRLALPYAGTVATGDDAFSVTNTSTGVAGAFIIDNATNNTPAIWADTNGQNAAVVGRTTGTGRAGSFMINNPASTNPALTGSSNGSGNAINGQQTGSGRAGYFVVTDAANASAALEASTSGTGRAAYFHIENPANAESTLNTHTDGTGEALWAETSGTGRAAVMRTVHSTNEEPTLYVQTTSALGTAVYGLASSTIPAEKYGGYFEASGDYARGVYGSVADDSAYAVEGRATGNDSRGVSGIATGDDSDGVVGSALGSNARGVVGYATTGGGTVTYGGYFDSTASEGRGVYGTASKITGTESRYGGYFEAESDNGHGAYGRAWGVTGRGLWGEASGTNGAGVYGSAINGSDAMHYGGYFTAAGRLGEAVHAKVAGDYATAVRGESTSTKDTEKYGGHFTVAGLGGRAVYGHATDNSAGVGDEAFGGIFQADSGGGIGVFAYAPNCYYSGAGVKAHVAGEGGTAVWGINSSVNGAAGRFEGRVDVEGYLVVDGDADFFDDVDISGTLTVSGGKFFVHPHPTDASKQVAYVCLEGGEHGVYVRSSARLTNGVAEVDLPEHFALVAADEGITVQVTPTGDCRGLFVEAKSPQRIVVRECQGGRSNVDFDYTVMGVRRGFEEHEPVQENTVFRPTASAGHEAFERRMAQPATRNIRKLLIANGTLTADGKVNQETARRLGWTRQPAKEAADNKTSTARAEPPRQNAAGS